MFCQDANMPPVAAANIALAVVIRQYERSRRVVVGIHARRGKYDGTPDVIDTGITGRFCGYGATRFEARCADARGPAAAVTGLDLSVSRRMADVAPHERYAARRRACRRLVNARRFSLSEMKVITADAMRRLRGFIHRRMFQDHCRCSGGHLLFNSSSRLTCIPMPGHTHSISSYRLGDGYRNSHCRMVGA